MWRCILILIGLAAIPQQSGALIFGADDRRVVTSSEFDPIGYIYNSVDGSHATAFVIAKCHALTVRHAFPQSPSAMGRRTKLVLRGSGRTARFAVNAKVVKVGYDVAGARFERDWALLELDPCPGKRVGTVFLSTAEPRLNQTISIAGFPSDRSLGEGLILDPACQIRDIRNRMILHDCSTQPGNSGSPIFETIESNGQKGLLVHGIQSAGHAYGVPGADLRLPVTEYHDEYAAVALPISSIVEELDAVISQGRGGPAKPSAGTVG